MTKHTVKQGDTLWGIAVKYYKDGNKWPAIYTANTATVKNPDVIVPGWILNIPEEKDIVGGIGTIGMVAIAGIALLFLMGKKKR